MAEALTSMTLEAIVGANLARWREGQGMSQAELGRRIGTVGREWSRQAVHQAEQGRRAFAVADLVAVALATEVSLGYLLEVPEDVDLVDLGGPAPVEEYMMERLGTKALEPTTIRDLRAFGYREALGDVREHVTKLGRAKNVWAGHAPEVGGYDA